MKEQTKPSPTHAIAYLRVSTDDQKIGPQAQADLIIAFAQANHLNLIASYLDRGVSGATPPNERPALSQALIHARSLAHPSRKKGRPTNPVALLVAKRDRLARDPLIALTIERSIPVLSADNTANGNTPQDALMRSILDGMSQYERALIKDRTKQALLALKQRGLRYSGSIPYGFKVTQGSRQLVQDPDEFKIIELIKRLFSQGLSQRAIQRELANQGIVGRGGKAFSLSQVQRFIPRD